MNCVSVLRTSHLGDVEYDASSEILLPAGLPGFEDERRMIPVEIPAQRPLVFLQSVVNPEVCFVALPVRTVEPGYELVLCEEDKAALQLDCGANPVIEEDVLCLVLLIPESGTVRANLDAPIVINLRNSRCMQAFHIGRPFGSHRIGANGGWEPAC